MIAAELTLATVGPASARPSPAIPMAGSERQVRFVAPKSTGVVRFYRAKQRSVCASLESKKRCFCALLAPMVVCIYGTVVHWWGAGGTSFYHHTMLGVVLW